MQILILLSLLGIDVSVPARDKPVSYAREVSAVLDAKCVGCHNSALAEGKLSMEDIAGMLKGGKHGPSIKPGKGDDSLMLLRASSRVMPAMPPVEKKDLKPLTPEELGLLKLWIDAGARDDSAELTEPSKSMELSELPASVQPIVAVDLTEDGKLVAAGRGSRISVYETKTGRELARLGGHRDIIQSLRFSPDGKRLAAGSYEYATVWDVPADPAKPWPEARRFGPHSARVLAIDFSPDGKQMATAGGEPSRSGAVKIWEVETGKLLKDLDAVHSDTVFALRFSPDGSKLATASADKFLKIFNVTDGKELRSIEAHTHHVMAVDWSSDGKQIVTGGADNLLKIWDAESGDMVRSLVPAGKQITAVRWVDRRVIAGASGDSKVRFWNPTGTGVVARTFDGSSDYVFALAISADGKLVAAGGVDGNLLLWNGGDGKVLRKLESPTK